MLRSILIIIVTFLLFGCIANTKPSNTEIIEGVQDSNNEEVSEENFAVPVVLSEEEIKSFLKKYQGSWMAFEFPSVEEILPGYIDYDCWPRSIQFLSEDYIKRIEVTVNYDLAYITTVGYEYGTGFKITGITQVDPTTYTIDIEEVPGEFGIINRYKISQLTISTFDDINAIKVKSNDGNSTDAFYYSNETVDMDDYYRFLEQNDYYINGRTFEDMIEKELWPTGVDTVRVSLYKAKEVVESRGLVFETDIPENEWDNPAPYSFKYIIDGKRHYSAPYFACKKGTTLFFYYY